MTRLIEFEETAKKELTGLDRQARTNILRILRECIAVEEDPHRFGSPLRLNLSGLWK